MPQEEARRNTHWDDVARQLTDHQRRRGADGMGYRTEQLVYVTLVDRAGAGSRVSLQAIENARIESALVHARAIAYFLRSNRPSKTDLHFSDFSWSAWTDEARRLSPTADKIIEAASSHLSHASIGDSGWEPHPGSWPLVEIATILSKAMADFVELLGALYPERAEMFAGVPRLDYVELQWDTPSPRWVTRSDHPRVDDLIKVTQRYLLS